VLYTQPRSSIWLDQTVFLLCSALDLCVVFVICHFAHILFFKTVHCSFPALYQTQPHSIFSMSFITPVITPLLEQWPQLDGALSDSFKKFLNVRISRTSTSEWYKNMKNMLFNNPDFVCYLFIVIAKMLTFCV
jgi:hypothetical protein